jgi:polysaccharide biosynthesis/export protein
VKAPWAVACAGLAVLVILGGRGLADAARNGAVDASPAVSKGATQLSQSGALSGVPAAKKGSAASPEYRLGPEDVLHVSVWENKELTLDVLVRPDGKISLPLIQDVEAEGLTAMEVASVVQQKLTTYLVEPIVSVIVTQVNAPKIYVVGNVARPGHFPLRGDVSVLQALSLAGGFTQFASPRSIKLVRGVGAKQEVRRINYYNLLDEGGKENYLLKPGDTIVVP